MCVLYVSFGSKVRPITLGSAVLFMLMSRLLLYSAGYGVNRMQVVLSGSSVRLFCFVQAMFNVCSASTVECFVPVLHGYVCCYVRKKALLQCLCNY